jgi:hypothetical protein
LGGGVADVFICHSRKDRDFVQRLHQALTYRGRRAWVDVEDIMPIADWLVEVRTGIEGANAFVFVISPDSIASEDCRRELAHAVEHNKRLVPIVRREVEASAVPEPLRPLQWIFFRDRDDFEEAFQKLEDALDSDLDWVHAHTRLLTRAIEWDANNRDPGFVLAGSDLRRAEKWLAQAADKQPGLTPLQIEYIRASRRVARRRRLVFSSVTFGLVIAVWLGLMAFWQRNVALEQSQIAAKQAIRADSYRLAAQSELVRTQQPNRLTRSVLLAVESLRHRPTVEASIALQGSLDLLASPSVLTLTFDTPVGDLAYSPDAKYLATAHGEAGAKIWNVSSGEEVARMKPEGGVSDLAYSPDGEYLATASGETGVQVWEASNGEEAAHMEPEGAVTTVAYSPDGQYLATGSNDSVARVWDVSSGEEESTMLHLGTVTAVAYSPDGKYLATASKDKTARVWEVRTGEAVAGVRLERPQEQVLDVEFSPDAKYLARTENDGTVQTWKWTWLPRDLIVKACSQLSRNLTREEWQLYLPAEPYRNTCRKSLLKSN